MKSVFQDNFAKDPLNSTESYSYIQFRIPLHPYTCYLCSQLNRVSWCHRVSSSNGWLFFLTYYTRSATKKQKIMSEIKKLQNSVDKDILFASVSFVSSHSLSKSLWLILKALLKGAYLIFKVPKRGPYHSGCFLQRVWRTTSSHSSM